MRVDAKSVVRPKKKYERDESLEQYAYEFIHIDNPEEVFNMKFDVIVSNPPYQLSDAGNGKSAKPIYQHFIQQAKKLNPRYMTMIIPSRWFSGGKGLDVFRQEMLTDNRLRKLVDYENFKDVFPGVDLAGGACYFLWERDYRGECEVVNYASGKNITAKRSLNEFEYFIRDNRASSIVKKVQAANASGATLSNVISSRKPFGLPTNYQPKDAGIPCHFVQRIGVKWAVPLDAGELGDRRGGAADRQPRHPVLEVAREARPVPRPGDGLGAHAVLRAAHPAGRVLQVAGRARQVHRPPQPGGPAVRHVVEVAGPAAYGAAALLALVGPDAHDDALGLDARAQDDRAGQTEGEK